MVLALLSGSSQIISGIIISLDLARPTRVVCVLFGVTPHEYVWTASIERVGYRYMVKAAVDIDTENLLAVRVRTSSFWVVSVWSDSWSGRVSGT